MGNLAGWRSPVCRVRPLCLRTAGGLVDFWLPVPAFASLLLAAAQVGTQRLGAARFTCLLCGGLVGGSRPIRHRKTSDSSLRQRQGRVAAKPWLPGGRSLQAQKEPCTGFAQMAHRAPSSGNFVSAIRFFWLQLETLPSLRNPALP